MVLSPKFSELGFTLPTDRLFGLGQHNAKFQLTNGTYSLYARRYELTLPEDNALGGVSGPHIHPFLLCQGDSQTFVGMFFLSTASQAFEIIRFPGYKQTALNYITLGGYIEVYFIFGRSPNEVIQSYHKLIGTSQMPPYYALGVMQGTQGDESVLENLIKDNERETISIEGY